MVYREYREILDTLDKIVCYSDKTVHKTVEISDLRRVNHNYYKKDNSIVFGTLVSVQSSCIAPIVRVDIKSFEGIEYLYGTLLGSKFEMGVALNDVVDIKEVLKPKV